MIFFLQKVPGSTPTISQVRFGKVSSQELWTLQSFHVDNSEVDEVDEAMVSSFLCFTKI